MNEEKCPHRITSYSKEKILIVNCRSCNVADKTIFNPICKKRIIKLIQKHTDITKIVLDYSIKEVFQGGNLLSLKKLAEFQQELEDASKLVLKNSCKQCKTIISNKINEILNISNPSEVFHILREWYKNGLSDLCYSCKIPIAKMINKILDKEEYFKETSSILPHLQPGFISSFIMLNVPSDAIFLESYTIKGNNILSAKVNLYQLGDKPEKIYFLIPPEMYLTRREILLVERIRENLIDHQPEDISFMEATWDYFYRFAKQILISNIEDEIDMEKINNLSTIFSQYTAGFGIIDHLLSDPRIQDIYVNNPVTINPLHLIVDGEEYTSNIFLSPDDVEALSSRFRTISGRAFSEASPILDMELPSYNTRVAAITTPLTSKGTAFALRKHREKPWTIINFIANNMISPEAAGLLSFLVDGQASILIAGSRGAGKTSLLSALLLEIPQRFRILTIEDTPEIPVKKLQEKGYKIQSLITKSFTTKSNSAEVSPIDALRAALRFGESVLAIGEVRGAEAKVLFEAMRIGAAGNLTIGTIHGATTRDVYERIIYDIGVPSSSFKAVDIVIVAAPIREEGGIERKRRVIQISEITKTGSTDASHIFKDLMRYNTRDDKLSSTLLLNKGQSEIIKSIAYKWGITVEKALKNIQLRTFIKQTLASNSNRYRDLLEMKAIQDSNNAFWMYIEESKKLHSEVDYQYVKNKWKKHLINILEKEKDIDALFFVNIPLNHIKGIATKIRDEYSIPIAYFDGDMPTILPQYATDRGFKFNYYVDADLSEYDIFFTNSKGVISDLKKLGAKNVHPLYYAADPELFRPIEVEKNIDVSFFGYGSEYREEWMIKMITEPSKNG